MKLEKQRTSENKINMKVFKQLSNQQLESVIGGPETSRGTVTNVQQGT